MGVYSNKMASKYADDEREETIDIISNLPSLSFQEIFPESTAEIQRICKRAHASSVCICANAVYFVQTLNEIKRRKQQMYDGMRGDAEMLNEDDPNYALIVGMIGCGQLGSQLARSLLTYGLLPPENLKISRRKQDQLEVFRRGGVHCTSDNIKVASSVDILFLCILPSRINAVAKEIKNFIGPDCVIYSILSSVSVKKLSNILDKTNIIRPEILSNKHYDEFSYDHELSMNVIFDQKDLIRKFSPLGNAKTDCVVSVNEKFPELVIYAVLNQASIFGMKPHKALNTMHTVIFGEKESELLHDRLELPDFGIKYDRPLLPKFDLLRRYQVETPVIRKLRNSTELQKAFLEQFCNVFDKYRRLKAFGKVTNDWK